MNEPRQTPDSLVDDIISAVPGEWRFNEQVACSFDSHVRKSVPFYDEVQRLVVEISEFFVRDGSVVYDIGASTGETLGALGRRHRGKANLRMIGIEQSLTMVQQANQKLGESEVIQIVHQDATTYSRFSGADLVIALYTLQFLPLEDRFLLVKKIFRDLRLGGAFLLVEKVYGSEALTDSIGNEIHWDFKKASGLSDEMILAKARSLRGVLLPMTVEQNRAMLESAGFRTIDVFFKWLNWVGIIAVKADVNLSGCEAPGAGDRDQREAFTSQA